MCQGVGVGISIDNSSVTASRYIAAAAAVRMCVSMSVCCMLIANPLMVTMSSIAVADLVFWKDPRKSGIAFGTGLLILLSLACCSVISVIAYTGLTVLIGTVSFRIYKSILQAVQKTNEGHPFR